MRLVAEAQSSKSRLQMLSDRAAFYLTIIAVVTGGITLATWLALSDAAFAVNRMVAVFGHRLSACARAPQSACRFHFTTKAAGFSLNSASR